MTENQNTPINSGEGNPSSPEQITDQNQQAIEALAMSHDELVQKLAEGERKIAEMTQQMAEIQRQLEANAEPRSVEDRTVSGDLLDATNTKIANTQADIDLNRGWGGDVSKQEEQLQGDKDFKEYLEREKSQPIEQTEPYENPDRNLKMDQLLDKWAEAEDAGDRTKSMDIQDVIQDKLIRVSGVTDDHKMSLIDTAHREMMKRRKNLEEVEGSTIPTAENEVKDAQPVGESQGPGEGSPGEGSETQGSKPETKESPEIPVVDHGELPELYARRKNLSGGDKEKFEAEVARVEGEMAASIQAQIQDYMLKNPDATPEEIEQFSLGCWTDAQNRLAQDCIDCVDGKGYKNAAGEIIHSSRARRFGAWMDRNGSKLKKGMLYAGLVGVGIVGGMAIAAGGISLSLALGAGTAIGAVKGASIGLLMSRQGSKESALKEIGVSSETYKEMFKDSDPADLTRNMMMSQHVMEQITKSADADHKLNVRKSRTAAVLGAVIGALAGSLHINTPQQVETQSTVAVDKPVGPIGDTSNIKSGELSGAVLDRLTGQHNFFAKPGPGGVQGLEMNYDNLNAFLHSHPQAEAAWNLAASQQADLTRAIAGADPLSNPGFAAVRDAWIQDAIKNAGKIMVPITENIVKMMPNLPATIGAWLSAALLTGAATRQAAESVKKEEPNFQYSPASSESSPTTEPAPEANPPQQGAQPVTT